MISSTRDIKSVIEMAENKRRDKEIDSLKETVEKLQLELNNALDIIQEMKQILNDSKENSKAM